MPVATVSGRARGAFSIGPTAGRLKWQPPSLWRAGEGAPPPPTRASAVQQSRSCYCRCMHSTLRNARQMLLSFGADRQAINANWPPAVIRSCGRLDFRPAGSGMWRLLANLALPSMHHVMSADSTVTSCPPAIQHTPLAACVALINSRLLPRPEWFVRLFISPMPCIIHATPACSHVARSYHGLCYHGHQLPSHVCALPSVAGPD